MGTELRKYRALAWALVATLIVSVSLFLHFLQLDHSRSKLAFSSDAAHAATINGIQITQLIERIEAVGRDYLLHGASKAQLSGLMDALDIETKLVSLCIRDDDSVNILYKVSGDSTIANLNCAADFSPSRVEVLAQHNGQNNITTDLQINSSPSGDAQSLEIRLHDQGTREMRAVVNSKALLNYAELTDSELTMDSATICLSVRVGSTYKNLTCRMGDTATKYPESFTPMASNTVSLIQDIKSAGLQWRLTITPEPMSIAGKISMLPFLIFGISLTVGALLCVLAYRAADKNILLEKRTEELSLQLDQLHQLEEQNTMLDQFAAMAAHDLQAPLRFMVSNAHLLIFELEELDQPELLKLATDQVEQGERMRSLMLDLLEFCRAGQGTLNITSVDARAIVDDEIKLLRTHEEYAGTKITVGALPEALTNDADKLAHIIRNLLGNAVKFSQVSTTPKVSISASRQEIHGQWTFRIQDNGPGVNEEHYERIFRPFARLDAKTSGTGMGLAIVKVMVDRLGGDIWIESNDTIGSTFCFSMPGSLPMDTSK